MRDFLGMLWGLAVCAVMVYVGVWAVVHIARYIAAHPILGG
jgi:hypothetical protein